jgi:hypothetical protein
MHLIKNQESNIVHAKWPDYPGPYCEEDIGVGWLLVNEEGDELDVNCEGCLRYLSERERRAKVEDKRPYSGSTIKDTR